jgi:hypothetical protein
VARASKLLTLSGTVVSSLAAPVEVERRPR